jgi:hypothetical protein
MQVVVVAPTKSAGLAILLTVLFGPLGMLYSTIPGAIVMLVLSFLVAVVALFFVGSLGVGLCFGVMLTWPVCIIWAAMAASSHNRKLVVGTKLAGERDLLGVKKGNVLVGAGGLVVSVVAFLWIQSHAPSNIATALNGGWALKEGPYYSFLALVVLVGVCGTVYLVQSLISQQKG